MPRTATAVEGLDLVVRRDDWRQVQVSAAPLLPLAAGQVRFRIERFALTANNITYALTGDLLGYWTFFPAPAPWGRLPVMGFATVIESRQADVAPDTRVFGFFPMASHLTIDARGGAHGALEDAVAHRQATAPVYRQYARLAEEPLYDAARGDAYLLFRGLFLTSFLVDDFLADQEDDARTVLISSASSKTAIALAFLLGRRGTRRVVGLTSARHREFVAGLGCYDAVHDYDAVASLPVEPAVFVDHSGAAAVVGGVHRHFGDHLRHSAVVGATHWSGGRPPRDLPGPPPSFFFAPAQLEKRTADWGAAGLQQRLGDAWRAFLAFTAPWLEIVRGEGPAAVERAYRQVLEGGAQPHQGHILSL